MMFKIYGKFNDLICVPVKIFPINTISFQNISIPEVPFFNGLVGTGCSKTSISKKVVESVKLKHINIKRLANTASGIEEVNSYEVDLILFNYEKTSYNIRKMVVEDFSNPNIDVLIGMDIISVGHFTIMPDNQFCFSL